MTTCVPIEYDRQQWLSTVFFELGGKECQQDRLVLASAEKPLPIALEADMIPGNSAAVVMLRFEIGTRPQNPLAGEVLLAPGIGNIQFETMQYLTRQATLPFYFADAGFNVIHSQQVVLGEQERAGYQSILDDAISHDAMIRLTGRYDAIAALKEVTGHYATHVS